MRRREEMRLQACEQAKPPVPPLNTRDFEWWDRRFRLSGSNIPHHPRLVIPQPKMRWILRWTQSLALAGGFSLLAYCAFLLFDGWSFQNEQRSELERLIAQQSETAPDPGTKSGIAPAAGLIGSMEIPRLDVSVIVMEGTTPRTLRRSAGHIPGTALPGSHGNIGISAHRDTFFRPLRNIRRNDIITIRTILGTYRYRVVSTRIVAPEEVSVLDSGVKEVLTLVTCYPFYFVGAAPDRFIVRAERVT